MHLLAQAGHWWGIKVLHESCHWLLVKGFIQITFGKKKKDGSYALKK